MSRWIVVSNRLPFSYDKKKKTIVQSSGGLVTAIKGIKTKNEVVWLGTADEELKKLNINNLSKEKMTKYVPIYLSKELYNSYYNDFSNDVLWPALHYEMDRVRYIEEHYNNYKTVNEIFAKKIASICKKGDVIWIHDYHLFLCPRYLKKLVGEKVKVGFFLHVPFPSSEIYRQLTPRRDILSSIVCSDVIGFHDFSYLRHFSRTVYDILGFTTKQMSIKTDVGTTKLGVYPVSIPSKNIEVKSQSKGVEKETQRLFPLKENNRHSLILGVDRLDYTKGIPQKLLSFEKFLADNPSYVGKVQLIQIAVPTRVDVQEYQELRSIVERKVGEVNGKFGKVNYTPVKYINKSISLNELLALYRKADVLLVSSLRDGMNLVCLEYVMAQDNASPGVVLLSEFAGAKATLSHAISINPHNILGTSKKIKTAIEMSKKEKLERIKVMKDYLLGYDSSHWAEDFMKTLSTQKKNKIIDAVDIKNKKNCNNLNKLFKKKKNTIFLDFDGTLAPIVSNPESAKASPGVMNVLKKLSRCSDLIIVSGRPEAFLKKKLAGINCDMAFEHGALYYDKSQRKVRNLISTSKVKWYSQALKIIESYKNRTPNSFIEKKNYSIAWHFRNSPSDYGEFQARNMVADLRGCFQGLPVSVILGKKVVEIKASEANKGRFIEWYLDRNSSSEINVFAAGDDRTDEDMFDVLQDSGVTLKIGRDDKTKAHYYLENQHDIEKILIELFL
jgi:trehalose 6-phosphate synthase/phosphatase